MTDDARAELQEINSWLDKLDDNGLASRTRACGYVLDHGCNLHRLWPAFASGEIRTILDNACVGFAIDTNDDRIYRVRDVDDALGQWFRRNASAPKPPALRPLPAIDPTEGGAG